LKPDGSVVRLSILCLSIQVQRKHQNGSRRLEQAEATVCTDEAIY
jgi:hypothetical protein